MLQEVILKEIKKENKLNSSEEEIIKKYIEYFIKQEECNIINWNKTDYEKYINCQINNHYEKIEGLQEAVKLFSEYLIKRKKILIVTDNDFDGTTIYSQSLFAKKFLDNKFDNTNYFNIMYSYGGTHGVTFELVDDYMKEEDNEEDFLIITGDNGINNKPELTQIKEKFPNVKIIITDHHLANEDSHVFGIADVVINSESIDENQTKSQVLTLEGGERTAISGGYTFFILLKYTLNNIGVRNIKLIADLEKIALMSQIGDIINYGRDHITKLKYYEQELLNLCIVNRIIEDQDQFNSFRNYEDNILKIKDYIQKSISTINASRRMNSILFELKKNDNIELFLKEEFDFDNEESIELLKILKERSRVVRNFMFKDWQEELCSFTYIKEIAAMSLWPLEGFKEEELAIVKEAGDIIIGLNRIKNDLRKNLVEKELYDQIDYGEFEVFISKKGQKLREILSIQVFIESQKTKPFLNLAFENGVLKGSMRAQKDLPFKDIMINNPDINKLKEKYELGIEIVGHEMAAGFIFEDKKDEENTIIKRSEKLLEEASKIIEGLGYKYEPSDFIDIKMSDFIEIEPLKIHNILNKYLYITNHPFLSPPKLRMNKDEFLDINGPIKMKISKKGNSYYINKVKNKKQKENIQVVYFGEEEDIKVVDNFICSIELKEDYKSKRKIYQLMVENEIND